MLCTVTLQNFNRIHNADRTVSNVTELWDKKIKKKMEYHKSRNNSKIRPAFVDTARKYN